MRTKTRTSEGFSAFEALVVVAVLTLLAALFLPTLIKSRFRASRVNCTNHLKQVGLSFKTWALDHNDRFPDQVSVTNGGTMEFATENAYVQFLILSNELSTPKVLVCPTDTNRVPSKTWQALRNEHISYFAALDGNDLEPQRILSGDDHLSIGGTQPARGLLELWTNTPVAWMPIRHFLSGNIGLADGSVQGFNNGGLNIALQTTGLVTNRLVFP